MVDKEIIYRTKVRCSIKEALISTFYRMPLITVCLILGIVFAHVMVIAIIMVLMFFLKISSFIVTSILMAIFYGFFIGAFLSLSLFLREILVCTDRLIFKTYSINLKVKRKDIRSIRSLSPKETLKTFYGLSALNLSNTIMGAVRVERIKKIDYVFSPSDREEFLAKVKEAWGEDIVS